VIAGGDAAAFLPVSMRLEVGTVDFASITRELPLVSIPIVPVWYCAV
jgi:hypothetical protein